MLVIGSGQTGLIKLKREIRREKAEKTQEQSRNTQANRRCSGRLACVFQVKTSFNMGRSGQSKALLQPDAG
ncbi:MULTISPECIES: hypothetical protein [Bacillus]|uniref:Uncharacterized protein n=1 Tax=Bacillus glycinifermentans TaxID=1664069 RepID=A0AAJ4D2T5_9BACI|nr:MULTISPECIES: hypothetical protein [Bacillus]KKB75028.1 hypothetical protein TH62_04300 [Bacillus sp. TH008]MDU0071022.1 hypothetical protein [Bacillus sp. IG6]MED8018890.1 hypothetical protein [Bacillus glycinifermentans]QAT65730.1 hypothetical protein EQZ20_13005 [Bacillus glycinifermentans]WKB75429.1 hypothetical protein QYM22_13305 [Bacillus glycinifermentans]